MKNGCILAGVIALLVIGAISYMNYSSNTSWVMKEAVREGFYPGVVKAGHLVALDMAPLFIAKEMNYFKEEGIDLETVFFTNPWDNNAALAGSNIHFSTNPFTLPYFGEESWVPMRIISSAWGAAIIEVVAQWSLGIKNREDLKNFKQKNPNTKLKIGLLQWDTLDMIVYRMLKQDGMSYDDFEIIWFNDLLAMVQSFQTKQIDILSHIKPYTTNLEVNYGAQVLTNSDIIWGEGTPNTTVAVLNDFADTYPETVKAYLRGIDRGLTYMKESPEAAADLLDKYNYYKLEKTVLLKAIMTQQNATLIPNKDGMMLAISDMTQQGYINEPKVDIILSSFLEEIKK